MNRVNIYRIARLTTLLLRRGKRQHLHQSEREDDRNFKSHKFLVSLENVITILW